MREGRGEPGARVARCKVIQPRPIPALREKAAHRDRLPPPHTDSRKWGERRGAPSSQPPPLSKTQPALPKQQESRQLQAGRLGGQHPQHARPSNSLVPQTCPRSRVQGSSPPPAPPPQAPRALPSLPVLKKASTSESAAPPSSAAPSGGFMTGGGRPRVAGGGQARGRGLLCGRRALGCGHRASRAAGRGGWAGAEDAEAPSGGGARRAGGACRGLPHGPPSPGGAGRLRSARAGVRAAWAPALPQQRQLALLLARLPVSIVQPCSALLFIFPPPSHPPCLSTSSLPRSIARTLSASLPRSLSGSPSGSLRRRRRRLAAPPPAPAPQSRPTMPRAAPSSTEASARAGVTAGPRRRGRLPPPRLPAPASPRSQARAPSYCLRLC